MMNWGHESEMNSHRKRRTNQCRIIEVQMRMRVYIFLTRE